MNYPGGIKISKAELLLSVLLILIIIFLPADYIIILPAVVLAASLYFVYQERFVLVFTIITFLTVTVTISPFVRILVQITNLSLLGFYFLRRYGLDYQRYPRFPFTLVLYFSFLLIIMIISSVNSNLSLGLEQTLRLTTFILIVYFYYSLLKYEQINYRLILKSLYVIAIIYSLYLMYEFAESGFNIIEYNLKQVTGLGNDYLPKNQMGGFFSVIITLTFSYYFYYKKNSFRYSLIAIVILSFISIILLNSRTSFIAVVLGLLYVAYYFNKKVILRVLIIASFAALLLLINPIYELFEIYFRFERLSTGRDSILAATANVIRDNWLLGAGPAGTKYEFYKDIPYMLNTPVEQFLRHHYDQIEFGHAHNFYLFFFSDLGIFGFIMSFLLPVMFFGFGKTVFQKTDKNSFDYYTIVGIMGAGLCLFFRGLFEWGSLISYGAINYDLPFWLIFIIIIYFYQDAKEKSLMSAQ